MACAYLPQGIIGYPPTAPIYPLFSGAISRPIPSGSSTAVSDLDAIGPTLCHRDGRHLPVGIPLRSVRTYASNRLPRMVRSGGRPHRLLRASGRGRCGWELVGLFLSRASRRSPCVWRSISILKTSSPWDSSWPLWRAPFASAGSGRAYSSAWPSRRNSSPFWPSSHSWPWHRRIDCPRLVLAGVAAAAVIDVPLAILSSGRAIVGIFVGTGASSYLNTVLDLAHLHGSDLYAVSGECLFFWPLCWVGTPRSTWARCFEARAAGVGHGHRAGVRLVFEVNFWGYYMMGVAVMLAALDIVRGRIRPAFAIWLVAVLLVSLEGGLINPPKPSWLDVWTWQLVFVPSALALAIAPLITLVRQRRNSPSSGDVKSSRAVLR